ncbi:MAG TPA: DUF2085 domain-containing protein [bacterium]|nr:DUF2085 domain-containing protein [bacterium]
MRALHYVGGIVCHQLPDRTLGCAGSAMALCARCTGIYTGILLVLIFLAGHQQLGTRRLPSGMSCALALLALAGSGIDILLANNLHCYPSMSWLRVLTGLWSGIGLTVLCLPLFNSQLLRPRSDEPSSPFSLRTLLLLLFLALPLTGLLLRLADCSAGIVAVSAITIAMMAGALVYIFAVISHALLTCVRAEPSPRSALLIGCILFAVTTVLIHFLRAT